MKWKKVVLVLTLVFGIVLGVNALRSSSIAVSEFREDAHVSFASSAEIPFFRSFLLTGLSISGSWEGPGYAQVWLASGNNQYLVIDTKSLTDTVEFSGFGTRFYAACTETCSIPPVQPEKLLVLISGPGVLSIDSYHFSVPMPPSGLVVNKIQSIDTPNHSLLVIVLMLVVSVFGAHVLSHISTHPVAKRIVILVFIFAFISITAVFGVSMAAPTSAFAMATKGAASIGAALAVILLFAVVVMEFLVSQRPAQEKPDVWRELEEAEEKWMKKK